MDRRATAKAMARELAASRLRVVLVPGRTGKIRQAEERNPGWYRRFCADYLSSRVRRNRCIDTRIKRRETIKWLLRIAAGEKRGVYVERLLAVIDTVQKEDAAREAWERAQC